MVAQARLKKALCQAVLWLGSAAIFVLAVPASALLAMIYGVSALVDRAVALSGQAP